LRGHGSDARAIKTLQSFGKRFQGAQPPVEGHLGQARLLIEAGTKPHHFLQVFVTSVSTGGHATDLQAETVGTDVDSRKQTR
jgi:hypothetical protein